MSAVALFTAPPAAAAAAAAASWSRLRASSSLTPASAPASTLRGGRVTIQSRDVAINVGLRHLDAGVCSQWRTAGQQAGRYHCRFNVLNSTSLLYSHSVYPYSSRSVPPSKFDLPSSIVVPNGPSDTTKSVFCTNKRKMFRRLKR